MQTQFALVINTLEIMQVVMHSHWGSSQADGRKKSRDGLSTNQIAGFGGVVKQERGLDNGVTKSVTWGVTRFQIRQKKQEVIMNYFLLTILQKENRK